MGDRKPTSMIDPARVALVVEVIQATNAQIVISSSWRLGHTFKELQDTLCHCGFTPRDAIIDVTPDHAAHAEPRGLQIQRWLDANPGHSPIAILDDDSDMAHLISSLVQTRYRGGGLQPHHVPLVIDLLKQP